MPVAQTATKTVWDNTGTTSTISFGSLPSAGSLVVVTINGWHTSGYDITTVSDNQGNGNYTLVSSAAANGDARSIIAYKENIGSPSGTFTVSIDHSQASANYGNAGMIEITGAATTTPQDVSVTFVETSTTSNAATGNSAATAQADEIVVATMGLITGTATAGISTATITGSAGTEIHVENNGSSHHCGESSYLIVSATGAQSASWTHSHTSQEGWSTMLVSFKLVNASSGVASIPPPRMVFMRPRDVGSRRIS